MSAIPKAFKYPIERLNSFSRQKYRLQTQARTTYTPGDQIILDLPVGILDMTTFTLHAGLRTSGTLADANAGVRAPPVEMLFTDCYVEIGGVAVTNLTYLNQIFNVYRDFQLWDRYPFRQMLQNELPTADDGKGHQDTAVAMYNWIGFLGTKVLDTTILPPVRLYLRLAPTAVLVTTGGVTSPSFALSNVNFTVDILDFADGMYQQAIQQRLSSAPLEIPFDNYQVIVGGAGGAGQSTRFSTSTSCLTNVMAWFAPAAWLGNGGSANTKLSNYFSRTSGNLASSHFRINAVPYPSIPANAGGEICAFTAHAMNVAQDAVGASHANLSTLAQFNSNHFVHVHSFTYDNDGETSRVCGLDARGNQLIGSWETTATAGDANLTPFIALKMKSQLRVGAHKLVEVIL